VGRGGEGRGHQGGVNLKQLHIGFYGAVMGLAGLGLTARAAAPLFPGAIRAPAYFTEVWVALGAVALLILVPAYLLKLWKHPAAVRDDLTNPVFMGFCGALPVGMSLVAGGVAPYAPSLGSALWWIAFALVLALQLWAIVRWLSGGIELAQINAGWLILFVGGIVLPGPGIALGHDEAARFTFGVSASAAPVLMALLFYRAVTGPPLVAALRPSWFILLVPPSLIYANGVALYPDAGFLEVLYPFALVLAVGLLVYSRQLARWPFGPPWWAFTFPLDALAYAAVRYAQDHPSALWKSIAGAALALATLFVVLVLWRTLRSAASQRG
jgi:tellurite resistance protein